MNKSSGTNQIVGIDIGSGTIKTIIGEIEANGVINIIGVGKSYSKDGIKKGNVINISQTVKAIEQSIESASNMATTTVTKALITISGDHIKSVNSKGVVAANDTEVTQSDVDKALKKCKDSFLSQNKEIIHIIPQEYIIDDQRGIKNPIGMTGNSLEVSVHVALANASSARNVINCVNQNDIEVQSMVFAPIASAYGVLTKDEKDLGVAIIDIGYATSTLSVYRDGSIWFSHIIPIGGYNITNDLALSLQIPIDKAEKLKLQYGYALSSQISENQNIDLDENHQIPLQVLSEIIEARVSELFLLIKEDLNKVNLLDKIPSGLVLTGGTANLNGIQMLAEIIYKKSVRIGFPHENIRGLTDLIKHPEYAAALGLLHFGKEHEMSTFEIVEKENVISRIKNYFSKIL
jgi:cell division protein FtsA